MKDEGEKVLAAALRKLGSKNAISPLTNAEAAEAYATAESIPFSSGEIREMVERVVCGRVGEILPVPPLATSLPAAARSSGTSSEMSCLHRNGSAVQTSDVQDKLEAHRRRLLGKRDGK